MNLKILAILAAGHFVTDINTGALPAFLPFLKESLGLSYAMTASILLAFNITSSVIQPIFGFFSDRWSAKWLLPIGPLIASLGLALIGFGPSYAWILLFASVSGLGQASYHPEGFKTVNLLSGAKKATAISIFHLGGNLGFALGPILATIFFAYSGLQGSIWFVVPGILMVAAFLIIPHWRTSGESSPSKTKGLPQPAYSANNFYGMFLLILAVVLRSATRLSLLAFVPFYFIKVLNFDPLVSGKYLSVFLLSGTVGITMGGVLADRFGYKRTVLISFLLTPPFLFLFFYTTGALSLIFFAFAGLFIISSNSVTMAMGQAFMPRNVAMASGLILGLAMGVGGIATTVFGWLADQFGIPFTLQATFFLPFVASVVFYFIPYPAPQKTSPSSQ
jgi:FSR family fosmidomycin resistance protein-like MFS transporter